MALDFSPRAASPTRSLKGRTSMATAKPMVGLQHDDGLRLGRRRPPMVHPKRKTKKKGVPSRPSVDKMDRARLETSSTVNRLPDFLFWYKTVAQPPKSRPIPE